jgi:hypothetical protein
MILPADKLDIYEMCLRLEYSSADMNGVKYVKDEAIQAMVGYDHWTENSVQMHVISLNPTVWGNRKWLREVFSYPFLQCNRKVAVGVTPSKYESALKLSKGLGFVELCRIKEAHSDGCDLVIQEMRRENCRWIPKLARAA